MGATMGTAPTEMEKTAATLLTDANSLLREQQHEAAFEKFNQMRQLAREALSTDDALSLRIDDSALSGLAAAHSVLGQYSKAIRCLTQAVEITVKVGDRRGEGNRLSALGICYTAIAEYRKSRECFIASAAINHELGDRHTECSQLILLGASCHDLGKFGEAIQHQSAALEICHETEDQEALVSILINQGRSWFALDTSDKSFENFRAALAILREMGDTLREGEMMTTLGQCYQSLGQYDKAIDRCALLRICHHLCFLLVLTVPLALASEMSCGVADTLTPWQSHTKLAIEC